MRLRALAALVLFVCLSVRPTGASGATITITPAVVPTASDNDFTRIQNALNGAISGDTIVLHGTFDFTEANAAASWALGSDGSPGTADDYSVYIPGGTDNITVTANTLGDATIQGPGDLAAVNLEGIFFFDGGNNHGWTISNLRIVDFDLAIGMFGNAAGAFDGTHIQNNYIRLARDLNATVAPADVNQNIAIHFSFGTNQSILNNTIEIPGDSMSDSANGVTAASVGMQSNSAPATGNYNGLTIAGNVIRVLNTQSADPETILGIWENGQDHASNVIVANNTFVNLGPGNNPALNRQRAFRVTSHSSATTTVSYQANVVDGANRGFEWITGANFTGLEPVILRGNQITNSNIGVLVQSNGVAHIVGNVITGSGIGGGVHVLTGRLASFGTEPAGASNNTITGGARDGIWLSTGTGPNAPIMWNDLSGNAVTGLRNDASSIGAVWNWWGSNLQATVLANVSGTVTTDPWLASGTDVDAGSFAFQPFTWATSSGPSSHTTFNGSATDDTGSLVAGDPVTMTMNGETAFVPLAQLTGIDVNMGPGDDVFTLGHVGVPVSFDGGTQNDTLVGTDVAQTWTITGAGSGSLSPGSITFSGVEALRGGSDADTFTFGAAGSLTVGVDGKLGSDTLDNIAISGHTTSPSGAGSLDGYAGSATGAPAFDNINTIAGTSADLGVVKSGPASTPAGSTITYTIAVTNSGPDASLGAALTDPLPAGTTFASLTAAAGWSCATPAANGTGTVTCTRTVMPAGGPDTFTLVLNAPGTPGSVTNTATVSSTGTADLNPANTSSPATTNVTPVADVGVSKQADPTAVAGGSVQYSIAVTNNGPNDAPNVSLSDTLPPGVTFNQFTQNTGPAFSCTTGTTVSCTIASLANGQSATFSLVVDVPASASAGTLGNTANVTTTATDLNNSNDSSTATVTILQNADVVISMTGSASVVVGQNVVYSVTVTNNGPSDAANVVVSDPTPAGLTFVSNSGACTTTYPCTLGTLAPGASQTITTTMSAALSAAEGPVTNIATVSSSTNDSQTGNNSATATTTITHSADLAIAMTGPSSGVPGTNLVYTVTVTNNGPSDAKGVTVTDTTPAGLTFVSNTGACATPYPCTLGTIASGGTAVITTTMAIPAGFVGASATNTATVTSTTNDPSPINNGAFVTTSVGCPTLTLTPSTLRMAIRGSSYSQTFTLTGGTSPTFAVTGTLPAGLSLSGAVLSGTPTERGAFTFTVTATGAGGCQASLPLTLAVSRERLITVGEGAGGGPLVRRFVSPNWTPTAEFDALAPSFGGGVSVASGDTDGDGVADVIAGAGPGGTPLVNVFNGGSGALRLSFLAYPESLVSGVEVASGDVNGDGFADIITAPGTGGPPLVRVFDGRTGALIREWLALAPDWTGGLHVGAGDVNGDGFDDIVTGAGPGGGPLVQVFDGASGAILHQFYAYAPQFPGGVYVAAGDVTGDGYADIVTGAGPGGGPHVRVFDGVTGAQIPGAIGSFFAYDPAFPGGVRVAAGDIDGDGIAEVITGAGPGGGPHVRVLDGATGNEMFGLFAFDPGLPNGTFVAGPPTLRRMFIDIPQANDSVSTNVHVAGWAVEESAVDAGVDAVHVWALPVGGGAPIFVGATTTFVPRPDVAAYAGGEFLKSGFDVSGSLPAGTYDLFIAVHNAATYVFDNRRFVRITVQ